MPETSIAAVTYLLNLEPTNKHGTQAYTRPLHLHCTTVTFMWWRHGASALPCIFAGSVALPPFPQGSEALR